MSLRHRLHTLAPGLLDRIRVLRRRVSDALDAISRPPVTPAPAPIPAEQPAPRRRLR